MGHRSISKTLKPEISKEELAGLETWLREADLSGPHLEIGTAAGGTLCFLLQQYPAATRPRFSVVDTMSYFDDQLEIVKRNLREHELDPDQIDFRITNSSTAYVAADRAGDHFDFILVDASHKIRHVNDDLRWLRLLNVGGIACFHDYAEKFPGVRWPIDRFLRRNPHFTIVDQAGSLVCVRKERVGTRPEISLGDRVWAAVCSVFLQWQRSWRKRRGRTG